MRAIAAGCFAALTACASTQQTDDQSELMVPPPPTVTAIARSPAPAPPPVAEADMSSAALERCIQSVRDGEGLPPDAMADPLAVTYERGLVAERAGRLDFARKAYFEVVQGKGAFAPLAYLAFGVMFEQEARADPTKLAFARQAFEEVLKFPDTRAAPIAQYFLARVHAASGEHPKAIDALMKAKAAPDDKACAQALAGAVRRDMVAAYASAGSPTKAFAFFRRLYDDPTASDMIARLSETYRIGGHFSEAQEAVAAALSAMTQPPPRLCDEGRRLLDTAPSGATSNLVRAMSVCGTP